nr:alpha/beta hydrolase [Gammaproteobacteria bacterium]
VAAGCALMRPDIFQRVALMSAPFEGPPGFPAGSSPPASDMSLLDEALASLDPPRKHYQYYYTTRPANDDMMSGQLSLHDFLRAYFHVKSADWSGNQPAPLPNWDAQHLGTMPTYYVMNRGENMSDTVAPYLPMTETSQLCVWLPDTDLDFYTAEYSRTGFQGGLNWYRCGLSAEQTQELRLFAGRTIDVPACFIAGRQDWGVYQRPGAFETMQHKACTQMTHVELVDGAGHWVQQEQPEAVVNSLLKWLPGR